MAWQAIIQNRSRVVNHTGAALRLVVAYYDDADPANNPTPTNFLTRNEFIFDGDDISQATVRNAVIAHGQKERAASTRVDAAMAAPQLAVGQTLAIP